MLKVYFVICYPWNRKRDIILVQFEFQIQDFPKYESFLHIGESLFTLFTSLTHAYHYLMKLIK